MPAKSLWRLVIPWAIDVVRGASPTVGVDVFAITFMLGPLCAGTGWLMYEHAVLLDHKPSKEAPRAVHRLEDLDLVSDGDIELVEGIEQILHLGALVLARRAVHRDPVVLIDARILR